MTLFNKLLIANRGEIACRIIRTAQKLGIQTVAVFSTADNNAQHVKLADEAYLIGPAASKDSYLNIEKIIEVAKRANVAAIHPGYGFLSENSLFAKACEQHNIVFVGPSSAVIDLMGNKNIAKDIMKQHAIPTLPGVFDDKQSKESLLAAARDIGFPIVLKAVAGGGGKGLRLVNDELGFEHAYLAVRREAKAFFNDDKMLLEKYLLNARHVEVQLLADHFGNIQPLFTRDCSIQRRHQKIIEEAPAPKLSLQLENEIITAAVAAARAIDYVNAGTIEFLVANDDFYFMEMNTRLQVEHPVTEMITGIDLVEWQLRIAAGEQLFEQTIESNGHAIEVRLNAEDPERDFLPSSGRLHYFHLPTFNNDIRVDSGYQAGDEVNIYYDSLLAKLIVWGSDRNLAVSRLQEVLASASIFGIKTNLPLLRAIIQEQDFLQAVINTHFLKDHTFNLKEQVNDVVKCIAAMFLVCLQNQQSQNTLSPWHRLDAWRLYRPADLKFNFEYSDQEFLVMVRNQNTNFVIQFDNKKLIVELTGFESIFPQVYKLGLLIADKLYSTVIFHTNEKITIVLEGNYTELKLSDRYAHKLEHEKEEQLLAPMPGTIVALHVNSGQKVAKGDKLLVIEAMKMEHTLYAPKDGIIKECYYQIGDLIKEGSELLEFEA